MYRTKRVTTVFLREIISQINDVQDKYLLMTQVEIINTTRYILGLGVLSIFAIKYLRFNNANRTILPRAFTCLPVGTHLEI